MQEDKKIKNYNFLKSVVNDLRFSQGFYGRVFRDLLELEQDKTEFEKFVNGLPDFNDSLDVIFFFEC